MPIEIIKPNSDYNFIGNRRYAFILSGILILASVLSVVIHGGLNLGVDFRGGLLVQVRFQGQAVDPERVRATLLDAGLNVSSVQDFGNSGGNEYLIQLQNIEGSGDESLVVNVNQALLKGFGEGGYEVRRQEMVGPKVGADLRQKALYAIYYAILMIIIYITGRFQQRWFQAIIFAGVLLGVVNLVGLFGVGVGALIITAIAVTVVFLYFMRFSFALGGIIALLHDVVITTGIFSIMGKEITLSFVAAVLTIIGYSLNDSIIVFDRIRENLRRTRKLDFPFLINKSVNETLSRTILTSGTTVLALLSLYFLGGPVNRDFALAITIGIVVGTYSSIFIASPLLLLWEKGSTKAAEESAEKSLLAKTGGEAEKGQGGKPGGKPKGAKGPSGRRKATA
ncbi:MAG: protein translocase subunit SecF [Deltaproteobacteria bacterium]|jgi:preprotein translocase subunit SecF|nr:protein translocase subunit SecF [Deltaproteobacteria bacterium]